MNKSFIKLFLIFNGFSCLFGCIPSEEAVTEVETSPALEEYINRANAGDNEERIKLAMAMIRGRNGINKNIDDGLILLEKASKGSQDASFLHATLLLNGDFGVQKNLVKGLEIYIHLSEEKLPRAMLKMGQIYRNGLYNVEKDCLKAIQIYDELYQFYTNMKLNRQEIFVNSYLWAIGTCPYSSKESIDFAVKFVGDIITITDETDVTILDTIATIYAANSNFIKAYETQKIALSNLDDEKDRLRVIAFEKRLNAYENKRRWVEHD